MSDDEKPAITVRSRPLPPVETRWKPGQSGNPEGRPANPLKPLIIAKLRDPEGGPDFIASLWQQAKDGNTQAARLLLEYSIGKPAMAEEDREAAGKGADTLAVLLALVRAS